MLSAKWALLLALGAHPDSPSPVATSTPTERPRFARTSTGSAVIDINRASLAELTSLPGIGPARAQAIIDRRARRPFRRLRELLRIRGIGRKTLRRLRGRAQAGR